MFIMPDTVARSEPNRPPCTSYPIDFFFPTTDSTSIRRPNAPERAALRVCAGCPLAARKACLREALAWPRDKQYGVVGGTTAAQRKAIIRGRLVAESAGVAA